MSGAEGLNLEGTNGLRLTYSANALRDFISTSTCKIAVLLFPGSAQLGKVFHESGVEHVIAFESKSGVEFHSF